MKYFGLRVWLTAAIMLASLLGSFWVRSGYTFEIAPLSRSLSDFPAEIGTWRGVDVPMEDEENVLRILNAQETLNRVYRDSAGRGVALNVSAWLLPEVSGAAPHIPKLCYTNTGWSIIEERNIQIQTSDGELPLTTLLLERNGERIVVAYWYQMGTSYYTSGEEARRLHRQLWGKSQWPATFKVLMQIPAITLDTGLASLQPFVKIVQQEILKTLGDNAQSPATSNPRT